MDSWGCVHTRRLHWDGKGGGGQSEMALAAPQQAPSKVPEESFARFTRHVNGELVAVVGGEESNLGHAHQGAVAGALLQTSWLENRSKTTKSNEIWRRSGVCPYPS